MRLRNFRWENLDEIMKINDESHLNPLSRMVWTFLSVSTHIIVADLDTNIVGFIVFGYEDWSTLHIYHMATKQGYEKKGIAGMLIKHLSDKKPCTVTTVASNDTAIRLYEKHGFKIVKYFTKQDTAMVLLRREANV